MPCEWIEWHLLHLLSRKMDFPVSLCVFSVALVSMPTASKLKNNSFFIVLAFLINYWNHVTLKANALFLAVPKRSAPFEVGVLVLFAE